MTALLAVVREPLSLDRLLAETELHARDSADGCGALCSFVGVVRGVSGGRRVTKLDYEAFEPLALRVFAQIARECAAEWPGCVLAIHHRIGELSVGEASVMIVAATGHRAESFAACRYGIERVKQIGPIWKHEFFEDGDQWVEGAVADPEDDEVRRAARARACA